MRLLLIERKEVIIIVSKYAPKRVNKLITIENIQEEIKPIPNTDDYYAGYSGTIYREYENNKFYLLSVRTMVCGYKYATIRISGYYFDFQ